MNRDVTIHGFVRVDNGALCKAQLIVVTEIIETHTVAGSPDPRWSCVDDAGHAHAYSVKGEPYPTLERHEIGPRDEDGWAPSVLRCVICKAEISPGMIPGPTYSVEAGPMDWFVRIDHGRTSGMPMPAVGAMVTMVFSAHKGGAWFGLAIINEAHMSSEGNIVHLRAAGQLGKVQS